MFADIYWGSVLHSLGIQGLLVWIYHTVFLSPVQIVPATLFLSLRSYIAALGLLANLKETRKVKRACQVEATSIKSVVHE